MMDFIDKEITVTGVSIIAGRLTFHTDNGMFNCHCISGPYAEAVARSCGGMMEWQPIETAPRDGTTILVYGVHACEKEKTIATVAWSPYHHGFIVVPNESSEYDPEVTGSATHWMPLPEPPK